MDSVLRGVTRMEKGLESILWEKEMLIFSLKKRRVA